MDDRLENRKIIAVRHGPAITSLFNNDIHEYWACYLVVNIINWVNSR